MGKQRGGVEKRIEEKNESKGYRRKEAKKKKRKERSRSVYSDTIGQWNLNRIVSCLNFDETSGELRRSGWLLN